MKDEHDLASALALLCGELTPVDGIEQLSLAGAATRYLAQDLVSPLDLPAFDNSAMDGFAVRAADCKLEASLTCVGTALAGHPFAARLGVGQTVRVMTGAPLPEGADAVVIREDAIEEQASIKVPAGIEAGRNVRLRGEHIAAGQSVLAAGTRLGASELGLAAAIGVTRVAAYRRLRIAIASTGDELADPPQRLSTHASYDANRPMLARACEALGFETRDCGICADQSSALRDLIETALDDGFDALLVSGGSAQGDADIVRQAATIRFIPMNLRPGRGVAFGRFAHAGRTLALFGLPGNAVAAFIAFHLLIVPVLCHLAGGRARIPLHLPMRLACAARAKAGRIDYRRARFVTASDGRLAVQPLAMQGSAMLRTVTEADALIAVGPATAYQAGELVPTVLLAALPG